MAKVDDVDLTPEGPFVTLPNAWHAAEGPWRAYLANAMTRSLLLFLAFALPWAWNSLNLSVVRQSGEADGLLRLDRTLATADDASYLAPVEDLLAAAGIVPATGRAVKAEFRTPGYGLWYMALRVLFAEREALGLLRVLHVLLFACGALLMWHCLERMGVDRRLRVMTFAGYVALPLFSGFLFHTLTEAVTPQLAVLLLCCALLHHRDGGRRELVAGIALWALLLLTRPVLGWVGIPLLVAFAARAAPDGRWWNAGGITAIALAPTLLWWGVNMQRYGGWLTLHPVYLPETTSVYRPTHQAFWELAKSWGMHGDHFHPIMEGSFARALACDTATAYAETFANAAPTGHLDTQEQAAVIATFQQWQRFTCTVHGPRIQAGIGFGREPLGQEQAIVAALEGITRSYRRAHPFHHHVVVPFGVLKDMLVHSNLNLHLFQHSFRGRWWMEALRWTSLAVHLALYLMLALAVFRAPSPLLRTLALAAWCYLLFLAWGQRGIEERYTLPVLHLAVLVTPLLIDGRWREMKRR